MQITVDDIKKSPFGKQTSVSKILEVKPVQVDKFQQRIFTIISTRDWVRRAKAAGRQSEDQLSFRQLSHSKLGQHNFQPHRTFKKHTEVDSLPNCLSQCAIFLFKFVNHYNFTAHPTLSRNLKNTSEKLFPELAHDNCYSFTQSLSWQVVRDKAFRHFALDAFHIKPQFHHPSSSPYHIHLNAPHSLHLLSFK